MTTTTAPAPLLVNAADWHEPHTPAADRTVWVAQRPLAGDDTWQGPNRYGRHYATTSRTAVGYDGHASVNADLDAREVTLVTNAELVARFDALMADKGLSATFQDFLQAGETPQDTMENFGLPWSPNDRTADALTTTTR